MWLLLLISFLAIPAFGEFAWMGVPASIGCSLSSEGRLPGILGDDTVALVGFTNVPLVELPRDVEIFGVFDSSSKGTEIQKPTITDNASVPSNAHWPDSKNVIDLSVRSVAKEPSDLKIRNPWEIRTKLGPSGDNSSFSCGGVITGGPGGSVAFINGLIVRQGDAVEECFVARIVTVGVILEKDGAFAVVPRGRKITIESH